MDTYLVPQENLEKLEAGIAKLNKRAARLRCEPIQMTVEVDRVVRVIRSDAHGFEGDVVDQEIGLDEAIPARWFEVGTRIYYRVGIQGEAPRFNGWALVAVINTVTAEDGERVPFLRLVPGESVPAEFWQRDPERCDHCKARRTRNDTFVVRHDDGQMLQVGRQCLADFLGHADPSALAGRAEMLMDAASLVSEATEAGMYDSALERYPLPVFLAVTSLVIRTKGWMSKGKARELWERQEPATPTAAWVTTYLANSTPGLCRELGRPTDDDVRDAEAATEWARELSEQTGLNDYMLNVATVARVGLVDFRTAGVAASILNAWKRDCQREAERASQPVSEWQGTPGSKEQLERRVTVTQCWTTPSPFGVSYRTIARDEAGNVYVWFGKREAKPGDALTIKGKVKAHDEYKGQKQTAMFYVKEL